MTAQNIALHLFHENGYRIVPCNNVKDIKKRFKYNVRQVFFVDDICGKYTANINYIENWMKIEEFVTYILDKGNTKVLATCRTEIFKEENVKQAIKSFQKPYDLTTNYSTADKLKIARKYVKEDDKILTDIVMKYEFSPLMCCLYSQHDHFDVSEFLNSPYKTFSDEWDTLKTFDKEKFCVLLLCVIYYGTINEAVFDVTNEFDKEEKRKLKVIFECCKLGRDTSRSAIKDKLNACVDTYFIKVDKEYKVIHDKMLDFLCFYFGNTLLTPILKLANVKLICERVQLESIQKAHGGFTILISVKDEQKYIDRLIADLKKGNIHSCLNNTQMKYKEYRTKFIDVVNNLNTELKNDLVNTKDDNGINAFIISCLRGYEDIVEWFISVGADPDMQIGFFTPITAACRDGHLMTVDVLLKNGASINETNSYGETGLFCACCCGHYSLVKYMLGKDVDINIRNKYNWTPLYVSCLAGYESIVNILIAERANDMDFSNSLKGAILGGHDKIIETLVANDCDVNSVDLQGRTSLSIASEEGKTKIVKLLIENNADIFKVDNDDKTPLHAACCSGNNDIVKMLINRYSDVNMHDVKIETPLHKACKKGYVNIIQTLLDNGADINKVNRCGHTPADLAKQEEKVGDEGKLNTLEDKELGSTNGLNIIIDQTKKYQKQIIDITNNLLQFGSTPLYEACERGDIGTVKELLRNRAIVNMKTDSGKLPLVAACQQGYSSLIQMLLDNGADIHQALLSAIQLDSGRAVTILLDSSADIHLKGHKGKSLIAIACAHCSIETIRILLEKGVDVAEINEKGNTLVHAACNDNSFDLSILVIDKGLDFNIPDKDGKYPLFHSLMKGLDDLSVCLIHKCCSIATSNEDRKTAVISALESGYMKLSRLLVLKGYTDNLTNIEELMLYHSCRLGLWEKVKSLLKNGVGISKKIKYVYTPLILADIGGNDALSEYLEIQECTQNRTSYTIIPYNDNAKRYITDTQFDKSFYRKQNEYKYLFNTCMNGDTKLVINKEMLVRMNLNVFFIPTETTGTFWFAQTPLCLAIRRGQNEVVALLLKYGAMVDLTYENISTDISSTTISYGYTPLFAACQRKNYEIVDMLLKRRADLNKALYDACREGYLDPVQFLVKKGANVNAYARYGQTVVYAACIGGNYSIVKFLIEEGAIVSKGVRQIDQIEHLSCLHVACIGGNHHIVRLLIDRGLSVHSISNFKRPLLHTACIEGNYEIVKMLIDKGVDINVSNANGCTALMTCVIKQEYHCCDNFNYFTITDKPNDNPYPFEKKSLHHPEHKLLTDKHYKVIQQLIEKGANIDQNDLKGRSVLFYASEIGEIKLVKMLLSKGADMKLRTNNGNTPISIARTNRHMSVVNVLKESKQEELPSRRCTFL
ncbi:serine/threonine-protein phosphatase 6 regulatory ankyrin repeat subunit A-like [Mytilus californianus]|uniref:serine/threonine-protein phosphatase 6 regulatory ankyrin repeat subunit A-like n=1 Tax=Mytilus californianus TaxID=6549 RepID=UPI0022476636|nr:serine/threonine-protein phosphatase 6 regulatory ankyrin repeat subunit A-like [Mytilus californianus]